MTDFIIKREIESALPNFDTKIIYTKETCPLDHRTFQGKVFLGWCFMDPKRYQVWQCPGCLAVDIKEVAVDIDDPRFGKSAILTPDWGKRLGLDKD
jgi:hypothetical protein